MSNLAISVNVKGSLETVYQRVVEAIKPAGFGILTRIDFDQKIKEKLGETIQPCIILGACNPKLAFEAYKQATDVALLIPCNIVLTAVSENSIRIEAMKPTQMLNMLPHMPSSGMVEKAEAELKKSLETLAR